MNRYWTIYDLVYYVLIIYISFLSLYIYKHLNRDLYNWLYFLETMLLNKIQIILNHWRFFIVSISPRKRLFFFYGMMKMFFTMFPCVKQLFLFIPGQGIYGIFFFHEPFFSQRGHNNIIERVDLNSHIMWCNFEIFLYICY